MVRVEYCPFAKNKPVRSEQYKAFIRSVPCVVSDTKADPHHETFGDGKMGGTSSDLWCIPLSRRHHIERDALGWQGFYEKYNLDPHAIVRKLNNYFFANGGKL